MKNIFLFFLAFSVAFSCAEGFSGGDGTAGNPFLISDADDLTALNLQDQSGKHFKLNSDISLAGQVYDKQVISEFAGTLYGAGYLISDVVITDSDDPNDYIGFFGQLHAGSEIRNLFITDCNVSGGGDCVGGLCGINSGLIVNCRVQGNIQGGAVMSNYIGGVCGFNSGRIVYCSNFSNVNGYFYVGGICGYNDGGTVINSTNYGKVKGNFCIAGICGANTGIISSCSGQGAAEGDADSNHIGGVCGFNEGIIDNSYSKSDVSGNHFAGGFCGTNTAVITDCYSMGPTSSNLGQGGFSGRNILGDISGCLWDVDGSNLDISQGGTGISETQILDPETFAAYGWDMVNEQANGLMDYWFVFPDHPPGLFWESKKGDINCDSAVDISDMAVMTQRWLLTDRDMKKELTGRQSERLAGDLNFDSIVNFNDMAILAANWLHGID